MIKPSDSLIHEIQAAATEKNVNVSHLLRKAKLAAVKLNQPDFVGWLDKEIDGYDCAFGELPDYRQTHGVMKARNPFRGLIPMHFDSDEIEELVTQAPTFQGVSSLQAIVEKSEKSDTLTYQWSGAQKARLMKTFNIAMEPVLVLSTSQLESVLERVTSIVLNWSLELEKAGILGEGLTFTMDEKKKAAPITQNFFGSNIGTVGSVSGEAKIQNNQATTYSSIDQEALSHFIGETQKALGLLPDEIQPKIEAALVELGASEDDEQRRSSLLSIRNILEGASGGVAAQGILALLGMLLG